MQRKLATIQRIKTIEPVITRDGVPADNLELATFEDIAWQVVVKKGQFKVGDKAIYIEISTVVPEVEAFEFLRKKNFKVKTQKFVGTTLSQGLAMPVDLLCEFNPIILEFENFEDDLIVGSEVTDLLGIQRYEPEVFEHKMSGDLLARFPEHIVPKTDQERIQSAPYMLQACEGLTMAATLKMDGTSSTFYWEDGAVHTCSRNFEQRPGNGTVYWQAVERYKLHDFLKANPNYVVQGEIVGPGIQKNRLGLSGLELYVFDIWDRDTNQYLPFEFVQIACSVWNLNCVELLGVWQGNAYTIEELLEMAKGFYNGTKNPREGLVIRPYSKNVYDARFGRLSFKVINNDYLLNGGE